MRRLGGFGTVGHTAVATRGCQPRYQTLPFMLTEAGPHLLAVRYAQFEAGALPSGGF